MSKWKKMLYNPVYVKETKLRVRNIKFALTILFYNLILIGIAVFGFEVLFNSGMNDYVNYGTAIGLYVALVVLESVMVGFLVPSFTAGSIAGEREKQTLEILLTTTMKPSEIVWGKLMASISMVLLLVVSSLPVISIVFTIGGLALVDLLQFVVLVFVAALLMGSIGVWASTAIKKTVPATVFTFAGIVVLCGVTATLDGVIYIIGNIFAMNVNHVSGLAASSATLHLGPALLILLINPVVTLIEMLMCQFSGHGLIVTLERTFGGGIPDIVVDHWFVISLICQLVLTFFIMKLAAKLLDPLRVKKSRKKGKKHESAVGDGSGQRD